MMSTFVVGHLGWLAPLAGSVVASLCATGPVARYFSEQRPRFAVPLAPLAFALACVLKGTVGRYRFGDATALASRYGSNLILAVIASYLILMRFTEEERLRPLVATGHTLFVAIVFSTFVMSMITAVKARRQWRSDRGVGAMILLNVDEEPRFKVKRTIRFNVDTVLDQSPRLCERGLCTFADGPSAAPGQVVAYSIRPASFRDLLDHRAGDRKALLRL